MHLHFIISIIVIVTIITYAELYSVSTFTTIMSKINAF